MLIEDMLPGVPIIIVFTFHGVFFTGFYVLTISYNSRMLVINYHYQQEKRMKKAKRRLWCHVFKTYSLNLILLAT